MLSPPADKILDNEREGGGGGYKNVSWQSENCDNKFRSTFRVPEVQRARPCPNEGEVPPPPPPETKELLDESPWSYHLSHESPFKQG